MLPPSTAYSPTPIRATTPIYEVKETRLQLFLYPPSHPTSLRLSFFLTRLSALPPSGSSVLPSSPQNLPRTQPLSSPFRLSRDPDERQVYGINAKQSGIHLHFGKNTCARTRIVRQECYTEIVVIACLQRSHHFARIILFAGDSQARS